MKFFRCIAIAAMWSGAVAAEAHVGLAGSTPQNKSQVAAPKSFELRFTEEAYLVAVTLHPATGPAIPLGIPHNGASTVFTLMLPSLTPGDYSLEWRVEGDDTHTSSGRIAFKVVP